VRRGAIVRVVTIGLLAAVVATAVAVFVPWLPDQESKEGGRIDFIFWFVIAICIAVFAVVAAVTIYSVVTFRARPDDDSDGPPIHGHTGLEIAWTAIPTVLVTVIAILSAVALAENGKLKKDRLRVDVTAQQFAWHFKYPQYGGIQSNNLRLVEGRQVELRLRSLDVIHSFWVPEWRIKRDLVPAGPGGTDVDNTVVVTPDKVGTYSVVCTELCGFGHATMRALVRVLPPDQYESWLKRQPEVKPQAGGPAGSSTGTASQDSAVEGTTTTTTPATTTTGGA
jgi:cytochrome c oxidase subunit 2